MQFLSDPAELMELYEPASIIKWFYEVLVVVLSCAMVLFTICVARGLLFLDRTRS